MTIPKWNTIAHLHGKFRNDQMHLHRERFRLQRNHTAKLRVSNL